MPAPEGPTGVLGEVQPESPIRPVVERLTPFLRMKSLDWDGLTPFLNLRQELFEIDFRFGQLGGQGLFATLDRTGMLALEPLVLLPDRRSFAVTSRWHTAAIIGAPGPRTGLAGRARIATPERKRRGR